MPTLSYDLHVHPGPSAAPRWGDGARVWQAAADAGVLGFVWKAHQEHTVRRCGALPREPVRALPSASLNPWARVDDVVEAICEGALWLWGPTQTEGAEIGWDLPLPPTWEQLAERLADLDRPLVLATGHLAAGGRAAFARLAAENENLVCSITHSWYVPLDEALALAERGCAFELDAFTYAFPVKGRSRGHVYAHVDTLIGAGAFVYFTSDGGQAATGNPFVFGARVLDELGEHIGHDAVLTLGVANPETLVKRLETIAMR
jgi:hypothetical protein